MFDYETLKLLWWLLIGVLLIGFVITDGFDMGVGTLLPVIGKTDDERRIMINSIAPHWEGNQVWLVLAAGAVFAAWPAVYATAFSGFYIAMMLTLFSLFFRPVGFDYRSKLESSRWRKSWDWGSLQVVRCHQLFLVSLLLIYCRGSLLYLMIFYVHSI